MDSIETSQFSLRVRWARPAGSETSSPSTHLKVFGRSSGILNCLPFRNWDSSTNVVEVSVHDGVDTRNRQSPRQVGGYRIRSAMDKVVQLPSEGILMRRSVLKGVFVLFSRSC
jgi:hypothetical protein